MSMSPVDSSLMLTPPELSTSSLSKTSLQAGRQAQVCTLRPRQVWARVCAPLSTLAESAAAASADAAWAIGRQCAQRGRCSLAAGARPTQASMLLGPRPCAGLQSECLANTLPSRIAPCALTQLHT